MKWKKKIVWLAAFHIFILLPCVEGKGFATKIDTIIFGFPFIKCTVLDLPVVVGVDKGFFKREGLRVKLANLNNPDYAFSELIAGRINITRLESPRFFQFYRTQQGVKAVSSSVAGVPYLLVGPKELKTVKDLEEANVQVPSTFISFILRAVMENYKIASWAVKITERPQPVETALAAVKRKDFNAAIIPAYEGYALKRFDVLHPIVEVPRELPLFIHSYEICTTDFIQKSPDILNKFIRGMVKSSRFLTNPKHIAEVVKIIKGKELLPPVKPENLEDSIKSMVEVGAYSVNGGVFYDQFPEFTMSKLLEFKMIEEKFALSEYLDKGFVVDAINRCGPVGHPKGPRSCDVPAP